MTGPLTWRNAAIECAFQCGITVGHLSHIFDLTERQIYGLKKMKEDRQNLLNFRDKVRCDPLHTGCSLRGGRRGRGEQ